jgi:hypothetical protein
MHTRVLCFTVLIAATVALTACDEKCCATIAGPTPALEPTFSSIQKEIFETTDSAGRVACTGCHTSTGRNPSGGLNLNHDVAFDSLVNVAARGKPTAIRVIPGDPENSYIVQKVEGRSDIVGRRMPFSGEPFLTAGQVLILKRWIEIGAPRN